MSSTLDQQLGAELATLRDARTYKRFLMSTAIAEWNPVFYLEGLALWAFGISWMTKGEVILEDA